jgi:hypothetical protein
MTKALYLFSRLLQIVSVLGYLFGLIVIGLDLAGELESSGAWISSLVIFMICYLLECLYRKIDESLRHTPYIEVIDCYF